jgi:FkbM family methyltransferase
MKALVKSVFRAFGLDIVRHRRVSSNNLASAQAFLASLDLDPGAVCFDVGANLGQTVDALLNHPGVTVHAFEPTGKLFAALQEKYGSDERVVLVQAGASDRAGIAQLHINSLPILNSLHPTNEQSSFKQGAEVGVEQICLVTLDGYCSELGIDHIDVLKIDVQGHEPDVLAGAAKLIRDSKIDWLIAEVQFGDFYANGGNDLERIMAALGGAYRVFAIIDATYIGKSGAISHADLVFRRIEASDPPT